MSAVAFGRDHGGLCSGEQAFDHPLVGVIGPVGQQCGGLHLRQQGVGALQVVGLARREDEGQQVAPWRRPRR